MVSGTVGLIHVIFSIVALVLGFFVLVAAKGTPRHKQIGYAYVVAMLGVNATALMIYRLVGKFWIFHWLAVLSLLTLIAGMYPVLVKRNAYYKVMHFSFMYWSVIGLYCAFMAETFSRLPHVILDESGNPMTVFFKFVGIGTGLVAFIGAGFFVKYRPKWAKQFGPSR